jgi:hypothetical protein
MENTDHLTDKQRRYMERLASGMPSRAAAKAAGYSDSYARVVMHRLGKNPAVAKAIEAIRAEGMKMAVYDLATAMREAEAVCAFAKKHKNAMAYCKATELRAKLSGLLIDRVEVVAVDLRGALEAAERRVLDVTPRFSDGAVAGSVRWAAHAAGDPVAKIPEDGESGSKR